MDFVQPLDREIAPGVEARYYVLHPLHNGEALDAFPPNFLVEKAFDLGKLLLGTWLAHERILPVRA